MSAENKNFIEISDIKIKIGENIFYLSLEQIKELRDILNKTFPDNNIQYVPYYPWGGQSNPPPSTFPHWDRWDITWCDNTMEITSKNCS